MSANILKPLVSVIAACLLLASHAAISASNTGNKSNNLTALGKSPNWFLELSNTSHRVTFESEEGVVSYQYPYYGPSVSYQDKTVTYTIPNKNHRMAVHMTEKACLDVETGKSYETTVVVVLDGKSYWGCGNYEHQSHM